MIYINNKWKDTTMQHIKKYSHRHFTIERNFKFVFAEELWYG